MPKHELTTILAASVSLIGVEANAAPADAATASAAQGAAEDQAAADRQSFRDWLQYFRGEAEAAGIDPELVANAFASITLNERVFQLNDNQPEFSQTLWDYLDSALSDTRVANGRSRVAENQSLLERMEAAYGVDAEVIVAIWGLESSYGAIMGDHDALGALATLAWRGRRTDYGRSQLIGALKIIQNGYAERNQLRGSWAGAMGQTQFIPTTYLAYAVDDDGDGARDIWTNLGDVFASTANYLSRSRYSADTPWGGEVILPTDFDYASAGEGARRAVAEWAAAGVKAAGGPLTSEFDPNLRGRILTPAGAAGPSFIVFENFDAILKYNNSTSYALAVGMLADAVAGRSSPLKRDWPRDDRALGLEERKSLQQALTDKGYDPGPVDGIIGAGTKKALRAWQEAQGAPADGYASARVLEQILRQ